MKYTVTFAAQEEQEVEVEADNEMKAIKAAKKELDRNPGIERIVRED